MKLQTKRELLESLIGLLYGTLGQSTGGLCHIILDDDNIRDSDIDFVLKACDEPENSNRDDRFICKYICELLKPHTEEERFYLINGVPLGNIDFDKDC